MAEITVAKNGPLLVKGGVKLLTHDGREIELPKDTYALCRCGHSDNKPFCDGSHRECGFRPDA